MSEKRPEAEGDGLDETLFDRRPAQAVRTGYGGAWLFCLWVLCAAVAIWAVLGPWVNRTLWPPAEARGARTGEAFMAVAYEGISENGAEVTPERFAEHLAALQAAGYTPIRLADVEGLLYEGRLLPRKAVLVTMDQSRKTTYFTASPLLRRAGWNAVMFLWTKPIEEGDPAALLWPYLRNMAKSGVWELGAQSHDGFRRVTTSPGGKRGGFMSSPLWLEDEGRYEAPDEFVKRLKADHDRCLASIGEHLDLKPVAYAYPGGDFGQFQRRTGLARPLNARLAGERYRLVFTLGGLAVNTRHGDPLRLNRLRVQPDWSGRDLVDRLDRSWPRAAPAGKAGEDTPDVRGWVSDWGRLTRGESGALLLEAAPDATGAQAWLLGSDLMRQAVCRFRFRLDGGQLAVYLRASGDGDSYVSLSLGPRPANGANGGAGNGDLSDDAHGAWLSQKRAGLPRFTLDSARIDLQPGVDHELEVFARDQFFSARLDGVELFRERNQLRGAAAPGLVGLSVWSPRKGEARVRLIAAEARELTPASAVVWTPDRGTEAYVCRWVARNAFRLTALSPVWLDTASPGLRSAVDLGFLRRLAQVHRLRLQPQVTIADETGLRRLTPGLLAARAVREGLDGVLVNLAGLSRQAEPALASWLHAGALELARQGVGLAVRLPEWFETGPRISSFLAVMPGAQVAVPEASTVADGVRGVSTGTVMRIVEVPPLDEDEPLPVAYLIPSEWGEPVESPEARGLRLEQDGLAAFREGQYDRAIALWTEWRRLAPDLPRPSMLIGDALSRKGDLKGAVREYDRSLELDPGQVSLAIRRAEFHSVMGEPERAMETLNLYARLFPDDDEIMRAQARWLSENGREGEALVLARGLAARRSNDVEALVLCLRLEPEEAERARLMAGLVKTGGRPENHLALGQAVWKYALTARPEAAALHDLVERIAETTADERVEELYARLRANPAPVFDNLATGGAPTNRWWAEGAVLKPAERGAGLKLAAAETHTEGVLRLLGSLRLRHAYVEATAGRTQGSFWLYACRTPEHLARFGLAGDGYLRLQTWRRQRLIGERKIPFDPPAGPVRLRLEARSDGLAGYVDGRPAFAGLLMLPSDMARGWAGVAVHAPERGRAFAELRELAAGPLPMRLGVAPPAATPAAVEAQLDAMRRDIGLLTAICPAGLTIETNGAWTVAPGADREIYRIFARYHRLWLTPLVACRAAEAVQPAALEARARETGADGFVLWFGERWPGDEWVAGLRAGLRGSPLRVLVAAEGAAPGGPVRVEAVGRGTDFFEGDAIEARRARRGAVGAEEPGVEPALLFY